MGGRAALQRGDCCDSSIRPSAAKHKQKGRRYRIAACGSGFLGRAFCAVDGTIRQPSGFAGIDRDGGTVRRNISISFASSSYDKAKEILQLLQNGKYKCLLRNIQMTAMDSGLEQTSQVRVSLSVTFYEYVVDSKAVEGLQKYVDPNATSTTSE